jgi:23S rRNA (cytidine1920-2'-O)/16S rRNA (cytidine1409-2'-O)-methyltransferase
VTDGDKVRLDQALVMRGLAQTRSRARQLIESGFVSVNDTKTTKTSKLITESDHLVVAGEAAAYVSRAAGKLIAGLDQFGIDPKGLGCLDIGASTGGFTQVLVERGAAKVIAVDVGHGQMHNSIASLHEVASIEGLNARDLKRAHLGSCRIGLIVSDVSFISLKLALPPALDLAEPGCWLVALIKPQFEAGKGNIGKGGIVRDQAVREQVCHEISRWLSDDMGWRVAGLIESPVVGSDGNQEYLIAAQKP